MFKVKKTHPLVAESNVSIGAGKRGKVEVDSLGSQSYIENGAAEEPVPEQGGDEWTRGDSAMRTCMTVLGMFSGLPLQLKKKSWGHVITLYHLFMISCVTTSFILDIITLARDVTASSMFQAQNLILIASTIWKAQVTICDWILFASCHRQSGFILYYDCLRNFPNESKNEIQQPKSNTRYHILQKTILAIGFFLVLCQQSLSIGEYIELTKGGRFTAEQAVVAIILAIAQIHWAFHTSYIISMMLTVWQMFSAYNSLFEREVQDNIEGLRNRLDQYRRTHRRLSDLVRTANGCLQYLIAITLALEVIVELLTLYMLVYKDFPVSLNVVIWFYVMTVGSGIVLKVLFSSKVSDSTAGIYDALLTMYDAEDAQIHSEGDSFKTYMSWQLFIKRLDRPEQISAAELFPVNKDLGITILSLIVTYYFVLSQLGTSNGTDNASNVTLSG